MNGVKREKKKRKKKKFTRSRKQTSVKRRANASTENNNTVTEFQIASRRTPTAAATRDMPNISLAVRVRNRKFRLPSASTRDTPVSVVVAKILLDEQKKKKNF